MGGHIMERVPLIREGTYPTRKRSTEREHNPERNGGLLKEERGGDTALGRKGDSLLFQQGERLVP